MTWPRSKGHRRAAKAGPSLGADDRRQDIDWLRVGAVYLLLAFHTAAVFNHQPWHIKNDVHADALDLFTGLVRQWHMPLLFVLAGWSVTHSLDRRGAKALLRERQERLLVPFVSGCVVLMPPLRYIELRHGGRLDENFVAFLPSFFTGIDRFTWMHLWFLIYLFVFTTLYLHGFQRIGSRDWSVERVPPWALYAAIIPFAVVQVLLRGRWPGYQNLYDDWANFAYYSLFFIAGFLLSRFPTVEEAVHREVRRAACIGLAAVLGMAALAGGLYAPPDGSSRWIAFQALSAVSGVCLVAALLGFGKSYLGSRSSGRRLAYARESAMPVYVLHQPLIIVLAVPIVGLPVGVALKFSLLLASAAAATLGAYHLAVRKSLVLRTLLGAKRIANRTARWPLWRTPVLRGRL